MKFPKKVYVAVSHEINGDDFLTVYENPTEVAEVGSKVRVGIYILDHVATVTAEPKIS